MPHSRDAQPSRRSIQASAHREEAFLGELTAGMAIVESGVNIGKEAAKRLEKRTILEICVLDSSATGGKHYVELCFKNKSEQGIYIESLTIHRPDEDNKELSILKDAGINVQFGESRSTMSISAARVLNTVQPLFPKKLVQEVPFKFEMVFSLLPRENMLARPYLVGRLIYSKLDEKKLRPHHFTFRVRWD